jgi:hypothetical protein
MGESPKFLPCDGCGLPASPEHIAARVSRLELITRYRPIHVAVLFVALAPPLRTEDDFYGPAQSKDFFDPFLEALDIPPAADVARLVEFQRRGFHLAYLSECPLPENFESPTTTVARLGPTLIRRIRFNYRPKHVAPLGQDLLPLIEILKTAEISSIVTLDHGLPLPTPRTGDRQWMELFQRSVATAAPRETLSSGYDRISLTSSERDLGAGGNS